MPSDVERAARVKVGCKYTLVSKHTRTHRRKNTKYIFKLYLVVLQDLLVDCFKPTEVSFFLPLPPDTLPPFLCVVDFMFLNPPSCVLSLLSPRRTSSQSCSTRSEGCRSSPRLRRNDGVPPPPPPSPPLHPPLHLSPHLSSSYRSFLLFIFSCCLHLKIFMEYSN